MANPLTDPAEPRARTPVPQVTVIGITLLIMIVIATIIEMSAGLGTMGVSVRRA